MVVISTWEERFSRKHFGEDTTNGPNVDCLKGRIIGVKSNYGKKNATLVYCLKVNMISGALYHLVATYSVIKPVSVPDGSAVLTERAKPKSQTLRSQLALSNKFEGLRSR